MCHFHPFACPVFVSRNEPQSGEMPPKWDSKSRLGLCVGPLPRHSRSAALTLNLQTGMTSPQHHVKYDNLFETLHSQCLPPSQWQSICHFHKTNEPIGSSKPSKQVHFEDQASGHGNQDISNPLPELEPPPSAASEGENTWDESNNFRDNEQ